MKPHSNIECLKNYEISYHIDLQGYSCPYPAIESLKALKKLKKGEILQVVCDCAQSINNIPIDASNYGYDVLEIIEFDGLFHFLIQRNF